MIRVLLLVEPDKMHTWQYKVAMNYTQLNFDYCMADRIGDSNYTFEIADRINNDDQYAYTIVLNPGVIFEYSYWESIERHQVEADGGKGIYFSNSDHIQILHKEGLWQTSELKLNRTYPVINPYNEDAFAHSHAGSMATLVHNSNLSYIIHNELPNPKKAHDYIDYAITVSSGFYINHVLNLSDFDEKTSVHHCDVSPMSLYVRQYTIENWNGHNLYDWMDHIYEKFPLLELFNGKNRLHSHHPAAREVWQHTIDTFSYDGWIDHWDKYVKCKHTYNNVNFTDNDKVIETFDKLEMEGNGVFWWNGALKRLPANILKTSHQSHQAARQFMGTMESYDKDMAVYGSDHCTTTFNGISVREALAKCTTNSRDELWKNSLHT